ncbi:MAG: hypothetical protein EBU96_07325, partial [Actinobacteria bacterium]|nr:hypothetical protein [Actinomycetota bacterium]
MDFRLSSLAVSTWLASAIVITAVGLANPVWISTMCATFLLVARTFIRRFSQDKIETKTLLSLVILGAILGTSIAALRIFPLATGPIAQASKSNSVVTGIATISSDPIVTQRKETLNWNDQKLLRISLRINSISTRGKTFSTDSPVMSFVTDPDLISVVQGYIP